jgi:hypothetical protein
MPHGRIALLAFVAFVSCKGDGTKKASAATAQDPPKATAPDPIGRGKYLVTWRHATTATRPRSSTRS